MPLTIREALDLVRQPAACVVAGGTDYFPALGDSPADAMLIDVTRVDGLRGIVTRDDGWQIGASTTWTDILCADLPPVFDALKAAAGEVGSVQIQNSATIAGNICNASPAADGVPPLLALDAAVTLASADAERTVPLDAFITGVRRTALAPGEMVTGIRIPPQPAGANSAFEKLGARKFLVISIAMVAASVWVEAGRIAGVRVAAGACSPVARRLTGLEAGLAGRPVSDLERADLVTPAHLAPLAPLSDPRGSAAYRMDAVAEMCRRALCTAARGEG